MALTDITIYNFTLINSLVFANTNLLSLRHDYAFCQVSHINTDRLLFIGSQSMRECHRFFWHRFSFKFPNLSLDFFFRDRYHALSRSQESMSLEQF